MGSALVVRSVRLYFVYCSAQLWTLANIGPSEASRSLLNNCALSRRRSLPDASFHTRACFRSMTSHVQLACCSTSFQLWLRLLS
ncbi:hypothetical protein VTO58DRAFT_109134 [Aureobasidium pullulans]